MNLDRLSSYKVAANEKQGKVLNCKVVANEKQGQVLYCKGVCH